MNPVARCVVLQEDDGLLQAAASEGRMWIEIVLLGLAVGILVGLMGIGGGVVLVPALVYLAGKSQHMAQGTSLFLQLPPIGLGALYIYWKKEQVDWQSGVACAAGILLGGYLGGILAVRIPSRNLHGMFGLFLIVAAILLWQRSGRAGNTGLSNG